MRLPAAVLLSLLPLAAAAAAPPADTAIRLFEQPDTDILPVERRLYADRFAATRMRWLGVEITASYPKLEQAEELPVSCELERPDGTRSGTDRPMSFQLFAGEGVTESYSANLLWGVADEEDWVPGNYAVHCTVAGKPIEPARFEVVLNAPDVAGTGIRIAGMRFFPVGQGLPEKQERAYGQSFDRAQLRSIGVEIEFTHEPLGQTARVPVACYFFWPDGQTSPPMRLVYEPGPDWPGGYAAGALGWDEPGQWLAGTYTANCTIDGRPVAVDRFVIE